MQASLLILIILHKGIIMTYGDKLRQTVYGPGAFVRLFPVNFLFASAQYEYNLIHLKYIPANNGSIEPINTI